MSGEGWKRERPSQRWSDVVEEEVAEAHSTYTGNGNTVLVLSV